MSRSFDGRLAHHLDTSGSVAALPRIHCFYEMTSDVAEPTTLIAATASMRAAGHQVLLWTYSRSKLAFLESRGVELRSADEVMPRALYEQILSGSEVRYFADIFRYAVLYKHGGLWMDTDVILLRPFPFCGDYFFNLQWRANGEHFICNNVIYAKPRSPHLNILYHTALNYFSANRRGFGVVGPALLSHYIASDVGAGLRNWLFSPVLFNSIDWSEIGLFAKPVSELSDYLDDERVFGVHLWNMLTQDARRDSEISLFSILSRPQAITRFAFTNRPSAV